jgi:hypothetical protein
MSFLQQLVHALDNRVKAAVISYTQADACALAGVNHLVTFGHGTAHRLFNKDMFASRGCSQHLCAVCADWSGHIDGVDLIVGKQLLVRCVGPRNLKIGAELSEASRISTTCCQTLALRVTQDGRRHTPAGHVSATDDPPTDGHVNRLLLNGCI